MKQNKIIALIILAFVIWWAYLTTGLPESTMPNEPGPKFFPSVILGMMGVLSVILFFQKDKKKKETSEVTADEVEQVHSPTADEMENADLPQEEKFPMLEALKLFAVFLVGILLVYYIGFNLGMIISLTVMLWMIGWKVFPRAIVFSVALTLIVYLLFGWLLKIPLPVGQLF